MFAALMRAWTWFVTGLGEAASAWARLSLRRAAFTVEISGETARLASARAGPIAEFSRAGASLAPAVARQVKGAALDIVIPPAWVFRSSLNSVAASGARYLDGFVRHQIDKITPWRAADVYYQILQSPLPGDPARIAIVVAVVPRRLVEPEVTAFTALGATPIRLVARSPDGTPDTFIPVAGHTGDRAAALRRPVTIALAATALSILATVALASWNASLVRSEIDDLDARVAERKSLFAEAARRTRAGATTAQGLPAMRAARRPMVDIIEALSGALPDTAYLNELTVERDRLRLSGVTTDPSSLVPALETSGSFSHVASFEATTRLEVGQGDRFHLEMRANDAAHVRRIR